MDLVPADLLLMGTVLVDVLLVDVLLVDNVMVVVFQVDGLSDIQENHHI